MHVNRNGKNLVALDRGDALPRITVWITYRKISCDNIQQLSGIKLLHSIVITHVAIVQICLHAWAETARPVTLQTKGCAWYRFPWRTSDHTSGTAVLNTSVPGIMEWGLGLNTVFSPHSLCTSAGCCQMMDVVVSSKNEFCGAKRAMSVYWLACFRRVCHLLLEPIAARWLIFGDRRNWLVVIVSTCSAAVASHYVLLLKTKEAKKPWLCLYCSCWQGQKPQ